MVKIKCRKKILKLDKRVVKLKNGKVLRIFVSLGEEKADESLADRVKNVTASGNICRQCEECHSQRSMIYS